MNAAVFGKELRALFPAFLVALLMLGQSLLMPLPFRVRLVLLVAALGPIVLGSTVVGHEYAHRTLTLMLSQPAGRGRLFATKAAVLVPMVAIVSLAAFLSLPDGYDLVVSAREGARVFLILAPLCGLCVSPALSMLSRSSLAAIVFTIAIPCLVMLFAQVAGTAIHGFYNPRAVNDFAFAASWRVVALLCLAGAIATWQQFHRLQAIEGQSELQFPAWLRPAVTARPGPRVRGPWSVLIGKELRLQQLAYVVACLYVLASAAMWSLEVYAPEFPRVPIEATSLLYSGLLAILIGAVASAEERQLGTLPAQLLQPMAMWKQWLVKVAVVVGLTFLLAIALPLTVNLLTGDFDGRLDLRARSLRRAVVPVILTSASLYVSSLSSSGVRAMVTSLPLIGAGGLFGLLTSGIMMEAARRLLEQVPQSIPLAERLAAFRRIESITDAALFAGLVTIAAIALWLAFLNHRRIDRSRNQVAVHGAILVAALLAIAMLRPVILITLWPAG